MSDFLELITTTTAVRRFSGEPVSEAEVGACLDAAAAGPSGGNIQPWKFLVLREDSSKQAVAGLYRRAYDRYEKTLLAMRPPADDPAEERAFGRMTAAARHLAENLGQAPVLVLFLMPSVSMTLADDDGPMDIGSVHASVYGAVQNFMLAARGLGIGTTLTTVVRVYQDELRGILDIPENWELAALVPMGRPERPFKRGRRRPAEALTYYEAFGRKRS